MSLSITQTQHWGKSVRKDNNIQTSLPLAGIDVKIQGRDWRPEPEVLSMSKFSSLLAF